MRKTIWAALLLVLCGTVQLFADVHYNFINSDANWKGRRYVKSVNTAEGLQLTVTGIHPNIGISKINIPSAKAKYLLVEYKLTGADAKDVGRLFFATAEEPALAENKKIVFSALIPDGQWHRQVINVSNHKKWRESSAITALRYDFMCKAAGVLTIRKISVVEVIPPESCPVYDFTKGTHGWTSYRNAVGKVTPEGLHLTIKGTHANLANYNLNLDPASCQALEVTFKAENYPNKRAFMRVYFGTAKDPVLDEKKKINVGFVVADGKWHTLKINANTTSGGRNLWFDGGAITKLRIDFAEQNGGTIIFKSIKPVVHRESTWRKELEKKGVPMKVPVALGKTPKNSIAAVFDKNMPFFESKMAAPAGRITARGAVFLRREFILPQGAIKTAYFQCVADDRITRLYINGEEVKHRWQSSWQRSDNIEVGKLLKPGKNVLALEYFNDGWLGGVMFDLSVLFADKSFINITTENTLAAMGRVPANWYKNDFVVTADFTPAELIDGPPNEPWTSVVPIYRNLRPPVGKVQVKKVDCNKFTVKAVFAITPKVSGDEVFFANIKKADGGLIAFKSGSAEDLAVKKLDDQHVEVNFGNFDLPEYGGKIDVPLELGIYNHDNTAIKGQRFVCAARPYPGKNITLKAVQTANGPVPMKDGKPFFFNILTVNRPQVATGLEGKNSPFNIVVFRAGGLREIWWVGPDQYDFTEIDRKLNQFIKAYPDSMLGIYLWCHPGTWYERVYPERISRQANGSIMRYYTATVSFSDPEVRRDAAKAVAAFVKHCEENFGGKIALYNVMGGISCEWQGWNAHTTQMADYSRTASNEFAKFAANRAGLSNAVIPSFAERVRPAANSTLFRDVVRDKMSILYDEFYNESVADMITICAEAAKKSCGNRKLVGAYYGYHMEYGNLGYCLSGGGHNALYKLLQSPYVDFLLSPQSYGTRTVGNPNSDMKPFTSIAKYGKFSMLEDDTRTHCTGYDGFCHSLNPDQTREVLRRNIGLQLAHKVPLNHLPLAGGNDLSDPAIKADFVKAVAAGQKLFERNLPRESEVAVVIDEQAAKLLAFSLRRGKTFLPWMYKYDKNGNLLSPEHNVMLLMGELIYFQRIVLGQLGFPVDYILAEDAPEAAKKYKMLILLDCFENNANLQQTFANAKKSNCHILSVYGSGLVGKNGFDVKAMSELLGMKLEIAPAGSLQVKYLDRNIGGEYKFEPRFRVADNAAETLANYSDKGGVAAASKGNVTLYGGAQLDSEFVQNIAKRAGVHVYTAAGDNFEIGGGVLSFHAASKGKKVITLKRPCKLVEIFTGETINAASGKVELDMEALTTKVFAIEE